MTDPSEIRYAKIQERLEPCVTELNTKNKTVDSKAHTSLLSLINTQMAKAVHPYPHNLVIGNNLVILNDHTSEILPVIG